MVNLKEALPVANKLVHAELGRSMNTLERNIFESTWHGNKYAQLKEKCSKSVSHITHRASELWSTMSRQLNKIGLLGEEEKVSKSNLQVMLARYQAHLNSLNSLSSKQLKQSTSNLLTRTHQPDFATTTTTIFVSTNSAMTSNLRPLEDPSAPIAIGSNFYIERPPTESLCYQAILNPGGLIRISAPRKMGKTSLMMRILDYAAQEGYHTFSLDLQKDVDKEISDSLKKLLRLLCARVSSNLNLPNQVNNYWDDVLGSKINCISYFEDYLLKEISRPLVIALDKVDSLFPKAEIAHDFLTLLRGWYEKGRYTDEWKKLRLVLVHTQEISSLEQNQSPFNIGLPIKLSKFTSSQLQDLSQRYGFSWSKQQREQLMSKLDGHPYLLQYAIHYELLQKQQSLENFCQLGLRETPPYKDYLNPPNFPKLA